MDFKFGSHKI